MNAFEFLSHLRSLDVRLSIDGERLLCNAPRGVMTAQLRDDLAERKAELIALLHEAGEATSDALPAIKPAPQNQDLPLSFNQRRLWLLEQWEPGSPTYIIPLPCRLKGPCNLQALKSSVNEIVRRHEVLRTTFPSVDGEPKQEISAELSVQLPVVDLAGLAARAQTQQVRRQIAEEAQRPFDLARGPTFRIQLLRLSAEEHVMLLTVHHIVFDVWSFGVFGRELAELYRTFSTGEPSSLAELQIQYADFAHWQHEWLKGKMLQAQIDYWKEQLDGAPALLQLPTNRPRPAIQTSHGARTGLTLNSQLSKSLKALGTQERCSLFITLLAAFKALLYRYTGQTDLVVGSPIANRYRPELEQLIGFFVNSLVLRTKLSGDLTFRQGMSRVREVVLGAFAHQHLPFEQLVEELQPAREMSHSPFFQVMFVLEHIPSAVLGLPGLSVTPLGVDRPAAKFDLTVYLTDQDGELTATAEYNTDLFDPETIDRFLAHYRVLLERVVSNPDQQLRQLPLMTEAERQQQLIEWNQTRTAYPCDATVHQLFEEQTVSTPDAIAVECEGQQLTYAELDARANQLAHYLQGLGVGPETLVGICTQRCLEMVVGLLGVLKAGGAYVPLDPDYPRQRLAFMIEDTDAPVLLTQRHLAENLPTQGRKLVLLDEETPPFSRESCKNPRSESRAQSLAYVMYTSGSTGIPKGTVIPHRGVVRLVKNTNYVQLGPAEVFLQFAPISFDASTFEIWGPLLNGGRLVIFPQHTPSLEELGSFIQEHRISVLWLTAALFAQMVDHQLDHLSGVRQLLAGGETLSTLHVRKMIEKLGDHVLINGYGPTENTTFTCCHRIDRSSRLEATVPIGRPIANTQVYILDEHMQPVPIGAAGELYIGGDGLAQGYLNQEKLTKERFVAHPFQEQSRLYRTGDRARYRADGQIEFLGRLDDQVKVRGFRVEPAEIETTLKKHAGVSDAAVICQEDEPGEKRLVAYVVAAHGTSITSDELRQSLRDELPSYLVPSVIAILESMPLTPSGKVDRLALPTTNLESRPDKNHALPQSPTEKTIVEIWQELLNLPEIGVHDDFFELGGHSLLATRVVSRLRDRFGITMPMREVFEGPTIAEMAERVEARLWATESQVNAGGAAQSGWEEGTI